MYFVGLKHQLYAHCHRPLKVYIKCFRKLIYLLLTIVFCLTETSAQRIGNDEFSLFIQRKFVLKPVSGWLFSKTTKVIRKRKKEKRMTASILQQNSNPKRFKRTLIYFDTDTQYAHFSRKSLLSSGHKTTLKQQING